MYLRRPKGRFFFYSKKLNKLKFSFKFIFLLLFKKKALPLHRSNTIRRINLPNIRLFFILTNCPVQLL